MFSSQDFLYPDGTPMDAEDIALMVNDLINKSKGVSVEVGAMLPYVQDVTLPYTNSVRKGYRTNFNFDPEPMQVEFTTVPVRAGVTDYVINKSIEYAQNFISPYYVVLGYNLVYSVEQELLNRHGKTDRDFAGNMTINSPAGSLRIVISPVVDRIDFGFDTVGHAIQGGR